MYNHYDLMVDRLTDNYNKKMDHGILKLIKLMAEQSNNNELSYELMRKSRDVDLAIGPALDVIGSNVGLSRGSMNDEQYKRMIKIKIIANLSIGDIPTLNKVYKAYLGEHFKGIKEGWNYLFHEVASLVLRISGDYKGKVDKETLKAVVAGGVSLYFEVVAKAEKIKIDVSTYTMRVNYLICNAFETSEIGGLLARSKTKINVSGYDFYVNYPECNNFVAGD